MRDRLIGFSIFILGSAFLSFVLTITSGLPFPSSIMLIVLGFNISYAFISLLVQRGMILLFESSVYNDEKGPLIEAVKYYTIFYTGFSYYVQTVIIRLPFVLNKFFELVFICMFTVIVMIFFGIFSD